MIKTYTFTQQNVSLFGEYIDMRMAADALPSGAYTTFRTYDGNRVLRLEQHLARLEESIALMGRPSHINRELAYQTIRMALRDADYPEARLRLTFAIIEQAPMPMAQFFATVEPFTPYPSTLYENGVACVTMPLRRENPHAKSTAFNVTASTIYKNLPTGVHEGLMVADDGAILEGLSSNFFAIMPPLTLHTEEARVLMGVTRSLVLELAQSLVFSPIAANIKAVTQIQECFITSVSRGVLPVVKIDEVMIGDGTPGPITRQLIQRLAALIAHEAKPV